MIREKLKIREHARDILHPPMPSRSRVVVIGAGADGLVAAREGHAPVVFECAAAVGGTWRYDDAAWADPLCMGFLDFPFVPDADSGDPRSPGHHEVLRYLEHFKRRLALLGLVRRAPEVVGGRHTAARSVVPGNGVGAGSRA